jgi:hypothetical protein
MSYDYSSLNGRIIEKYGNRYSFAEAMGISTKSLSMKLNNKTTFKQSEILQAMDLLDLSEQDIQPYFFKLKVQNA